MAAFWNKQSKTDKQVAEEILQSTGATIEPDKKSPKPQGAKDSQKKESIFQKKDQSKLDPKHSETTVEEHFDKKIEEKKDLSNQVLDEIAQGSKQVQKWNFMVHMAKRVRSGEYSFRKQGMKGLTQEYDLYRERKQKAQEKYLTYETVVANATDSQEYYILLVLSCLIATFGLYSDSAAVIIGAMIVAPLMGPILGLSAGVMWGSGKVVKEALTTLIFGVIIVLGLTSLLTFLIPFVPVTGQILARTNPGLLDIGIAIASGVVGAYAYANKKISASIPGVAISVALMPPLSTVGIGIGLQRWDVASGAAILFGVNLLGISLAALVVFIIVGLHPHVTVDEEQVSRITKRVAGQIVFSLVALILIAAPMTLISIDFVRENQIRQQISQYIESQVNPTDRGEIEFFSSSEQVRVRFVLYQQPQTLNLLAWEQELTQQLGRPVVFEVFKLQPLAR
jgi:uncharacterized hydrophobic protein (TIGR00271 family)